MSEAITHDTRLSHLFRVYPSLLEVMIAQSAHFERLRNPLLRKALTPLTTIEQAARIAGVDVDGLVSTLREAVGQSQGADVSPVASRLQRGAKAAERAWLNTPDPVSDTPPAWLDAPVATTLDVREQQRRGEPVIQPILDVARTVTGGKQWILLNTFDPLPLYAVMRKQGFEGWGVQRAPEEWEIHFFRRQDEPDEPGQPSHLEADQAHDLQRVATAQLDVRHLPPPEPMQQILAALNNLDAGQWLYVHHARRPVHLLPLLEEQGHGYECIPRADRDVDFWVRKGGAI